MGIRDLSVRWRQLPSLAFALCVGIAQAQQAGGPRNGLVVSMPNGFATFSVDDMRLKTTAGDLRWSRYWNGREWTFNPQWESLSQSWRNLTGSQAADTTGSAGNGSAGGGGSCWVTADEDWTPPAAGADGVVPLQPARSTPFNRVMAEVVPIAAFIASVRVTLDYATLCPGVVVSNTLVNQEAIRRGNGLYVGENGHYAFNNRATIEKSAVVQLAPVAVTAPYAQLGTGRVALAPVGVANGYRWRDRAGEWIHYNGAGQAVAYGDRNNNTVWLQRDTDGILRGVVDAYGRVLVTLHYGADMTLAEVRDYPDSTNALDLPARTVRYQYDAYKRMTQAIDVRGNATKYDYDNQNHITQVTDPEGRAEQLAYNGNIVSRHTAPDGGVTDYAFDYDGANKQFIAKKTGPATAAGRRVDEYTHNRVGQLVKRVANGRVDDLISYDTAARTESHTNARGFVEVRTRDEFGQTVQVQLTDGSLVSAGFSALHLQLTDQTDEAGTKTLYERNAAGNLLKMTQAAGLSEQRVTEYVVNALGQTIQASRKGRAEADGSMTADATWKFEYDAQGQVSQTTDPEGNIRRYIFDRAGNLTSQTDPLGNTTRYVSDAAGNLTQVTDALGRTYRFAFDKVGNLTTLTDARGKATLAAYDAMNRLVQSTNAVGGVYKRQYDAMGQVIQEADEDGVTRSAQFDTFQRLTQVADGLGNLTKLSYLIPDGSSAGALGSLGAPTEIQYPTFTQRQRYDARERPTANILLNPSSQGLQTITGAQSYDKLGALTTSTDAAGKQRQRTLDALGQATQFTDALGNKTQLRYDARGNLLSLTDANGNTTRFTYDRNDRLLQETLPLGQKTSYQYDAAGNLRERRDALGNKAVFSYDAANRLTSTKRYDPTGAQVRDTTLTWDAADNLTAWSDADLTRPTGQQTSSAVATFDDANRKTAETTTYPNPAGGTYAMSTGYAYSPAGRKTQIIWPDGSAIGYGYSPHGVLQTVQVPGEGTISVNNYNWVAPAKITLPGGTTQQTGYDGLLKQESLKVTSPTQQPILSLDNRYGLLQQLQSKTRTDTSSSGASSTTTTSYTYDDEIRLTQATTDRGTGTPDVETFTLDALANRTAHSKTQGTWTYDANNRLLQSGTGPNGATYQWDDNGRLTRKTEANGRVWQYGYDTQNRLSEVKDGQGNLIVRYGYDPIDRRLWKEQYRDGAGIQLSQAKRTYFAYTDEGLVSEATQLGDIGPSGSAQFNQVPSVASQYGPQPNFPFSTAYLFQKYKNVGGSDFVVLLHRDSLDVPVIGSTVSGQVVTSTNFGPFGDIGGRDLASTDGVEANMAFPGQYIDEELGLNYNYHRYYDPRIGVYMSADPVGLYGGLNYYVYAGASPTRFVDPYGLYDWAMFAAGGFKVVYGGVKIVAGGTLIVAGTAADLTGIFAVLGVPVQVAGGVIAGGGLLNVVGGLRRIRDAWRDPCADFDWRSGVGAIPLVGGGAEYLLKNPPKSRAWETPPSNEYGRPGGCGDAWCLMYK